MAKKSAGKPRGVAAIEVIDEDHDDISDEQRHEGNGSRSASESSATKPGRKAKAKPEQQSAGNFGVGDIKKAAAFANSIGGLDKAISLLQILKVAKEVQ